MVDILHRIGATAAPEKVYDALTTRDGLAAWWTTGGFDMKVLDQRQNDRVEWEVVDGPAEWIGTHVTFDLSREGDYTIVLFKHEGWREPVEFMSHCSTKWATFLMSLKRLVETGTGAPHPQDVRISNWH
jgi:hypothetical protein